MKDNTFTKYNLILYLIWPLLGLVIAFKSKKNRFVKTFLPIFTGVLGYTYQPQEGADINMLIEMFDSYKDLSIAGKFEYLFTTKISNFFENGIELYLDLIAFATSMFTNNYKWSLFVLGYVYGILFYNFYKKISLNYVKANSLFYRVLFLSIVLFIQPSMAFNGRFWFATLLFLYFVIAYFNNPKIKYVLFSLVLILIHKGFFVAFILFFIWHYTKRIKFRKYVYMLLLFSSIVTPGSLMLNLIRLNVDNISESYQNQAEGYTREKYIERMDNVSESRSAIFNLYSLRFVILFYASAIFMIYFYLKKYFFLNKDVENLFYLVILFISFSNFFIEVPSLGSRYRFIASGMMLILFLLALKYVKINPNKIYPNLLTISLVFVFLVNLRMDFEQLYGFSYILNPLISYIFIQDITIIELIR